MTGRAVVPLAAAVAVAGCSGSPAQPDRRGVPRQALRPRRLPRSPLAFERQPPPLPLRPQAEQLAPPARLADPPGCPRRRGDRAPALRRGRRQRKRLAPDARGLRLPAPAL